MLSKKRILEKLNQATSHTAKEIFSDELLDKFATFYEDKWDEVTSDDVVAESLVDFYWGNEIQCRRCDVCGKLFAEGYHSESKEEYYCSEECLNTEFSQEEWEKECDEYDQSYYTNWN